MIRNQIQITWTQITNQIKSWCQPNDNSSRLYSLCAKCHQCTSGLTVIVSAKIRDGIMAQITESCDSFKSPNQITLNEMKCNQIICFQIKSFLLKSNHHQWFNHDLNQIMIWICPSLLHCVTAQTLYCLCQQSCNTSPPQVKSKCLQQIGWLARQFQWHHQC